MIKIFIGNDRVRAGQEINHLLGSDHETYDGVDLSPQDLPSLFYGGTLFNDVRHILIRDYSSNQSIYEKLPDYLNTPHHVILLESKLDKRSTIFKAIKSKITIQEFKLPEQHNQFYSFDICRVAKRNGEEAVRMLKEIEPTTDPIMFFGAITSVVLKDYAAHQGAKEKQALKELAKLDLQIKSTTIEPWILIESYLLRISNLGS